MLWATLMIILNSCKIFQSVAVNNDDFMLKTKLTAYECADYLFGEKYRGFILYPRENVSFNQNVWAKLIMPFPNTKDTPMKNWADLRDKPPPRCPKYQIQNHAVIDKQTGRPSDEWCKQFNTVFAFAMFNYSIYSCSYMNKKFERTGCFFIPSRLFGLVTLDRDMVIVQEEDVEKLLGEKYSKTEHVCKTYFEIAQKTTGHYSYFHGYPVVMMPLVTLSTVSVDNKLKTTFSRNFATFNEGFNYTKLDYDNSTGNTENLKGVEFKSVNWTAVLLPNGNLWHYYLSLYNFPGFLYAVLYHGYRAGYSMIAPPSFDDRKAPHELESYFNELKILIEYTYVTNNDRKVVLVAGGEQGLYMLYFLNQRSQVWKSKYIKSFVPFGTPFGGHVDTIYKLAAPSLHGVDYSYYNEVFRSFPGSYLALPVEQTYGSHVLISLGSKNYTAADYETLFYDIKCPTCWNMYKKTREVLQPLTAPGVPVYCLMYNDTSHTDVFAAIESQQRCLQWRKSLLQWETLSPVFEKTLGIDFQSRTINITAFDDIMKELINVFFDTAWYRFSLF